jgi:hypothetical protein
MSNAGGFKSLNRYYDMLAGNNVWNPWEPDGAYDALATVTVPSGGLASITFAAIPQTYKHLQIRGIAATTFTSGTASASPFTIGFNSDTTFTNYRTHQLLGDGSTAQAYTVQASGWLAGVGSAVNADTSNTFTGFVIDILDYSSTSKNKVTRSLFGNDRNGSGDINLFSGLWMNTSAITSITTQFPQSPRSFAQNSQFTLYGVR